MSGISKHLRNRSPHPVQIPQPNIRRLTTVHGILPVLRSLARNHAAIIGFSSLEHIHTWARRLAAKQRLADTRPNDIVQALLAERIVSPEEASGIFFVDGKLARRWVHILSSPVAITDREPRQRLPPSDRRPCILDADQLYASLRIDPS